MTSRELVNKALEFELHEGERIPRQLWTLPWADEHYPGAKDAILRDFPDDIVAAPSFCTISEEGRSSGDIYKIGTFIDEWGCIFENCQSGVVGEVKNPVVNEWSDTSRVHIPEEQLSIDIGQINDFCRCTDKFVLPCAFPRPFERLQFIRGTENLFVDLAVGDEGLERFIAKMHHFYMSQMELWSRTEVDALFFMDDWGTQKNLLINPEMWRRVFKPLYKDYIDIAHFAGKKIFMHSDGNILEIYPDLIELGLDAINSQIFCMGVRNLAKYKGKITFWGEMDRQHILPHGTPAEVAEAVREAYDSLFADGGVIAQCEFGPGARPENVRAVYAAWNSIRRQEPQPNPKSEYRNPKQ